MTLGISRHAGRDRLARHRHRDGYIAVVLAGGYIEAGDGGRQRVAAGHVIVHHPWSAHRDDFEGRGAVVLNLPLVAGLDEQVATLDDMDAVACLAERDPQEAAVLVGASLRPADAAVNDWPDALAAELAAKPDLAIGSWARRLGIAPASLSRGFAMAFGVSPKRFRLEQRTRRALQLLPHWRGSLATLAAETGFADQAHLARATVAMTGRPPSALR